MNNKDEYLVYTKPVGTKLYYKNKKLHREAGPAIVIPEDLDKYSQLSDSDLYIPTDQPVETITVKSNDEKRDASTKITTMKILKRRRSSLPLIYSLEDPIEYNYDFFSSYWLEGKNYSKEEFTSIMLKKEMEQELPTSEYQPKKLKI